MRISMLMAVAFASLAMPSTAWAQRARIPLQIDYGWATAYSHLGAVPANSEILAEAPGEKLTVGFVYEQYWLVLPWWTRAGSFAIYRSVDPPDTPGEFWLLKEQTPAKLARLTGLPGGRFTRPFSYYVPMGWPVVAGIVLLIKLTSGPSAKTRFERLWDDPRYRGSVAAMLGLSESALPVPCEVIALGAPPDDVGNRFDDEVARLQELGVTRSKALKNLEFLMSYLLDNGKVVVIDMGQAPRAPDGPSPL